MNNRDVIVFIVHLTSYSLIVEATVWLWFLEFENNYM